MTGFQVLTSNRHRRQILNVRRNIRSITEHYAFAAIVFCTSWFSALLILLLLWKQRSGDIEEAANPWSWICSSSQTITSSSFQGCHKISPGLLKALVVVRSILAKMSVLHCMNVKGWISNVCVSYKSHMQRENCLIRQKKNKLDLFLPKVTRCCFVIVHSHTAS